MKVNPIKEIVAGIYYVSIYIYYTCIQPIRILKNEITIGKLFLVPAYKYNNNM